MGRAMLIICAGMLVALGIVAMGTSSQGKLMTKKTVEYAQKTQALNAAHTAIQIVTQEINKKGIENMDQQYVDDRNSSNSWTPSTVNGADIVLSIEFLNSDWETNPYFEEDKLRVISEATIDNEYEANVKSVYEVAPFSNLVPKFKSPLTIATKNFTIDTDGSASISGNSPSACQDGEDPNKQGITVMNQNLEDNVQSETSNIDIEGDPKVSVDSDLSYQPTDELIARLANTDGVRHVSGTTDETLGTASDPGVFFVGDNLKLTGKQKEGYGILVIRDDGELQYEGEDGATLDIAGNFEWNGLVIFENAYNLKGTGTPTINGSVLIGNTKDYEDSININLNGNIHLQYDCAGENYAKKAAADAVKQNQYTRLVTSEETNHQ
jgi:hypothetical protein